MKDKTTDVAVVGSSVVGVLVAIAVSKRGRSVTLCEEMSDNAAIDSLFEVPPTTVTPVSLVGGTFAARIRQELESAGVESQGIAVQISLCSDRAALVENSDGLRIRARVVLYSPNGVEGGLPWVPGIEALIGRGVSKDAWSDAAFFKGCPVAVVGGDRRAAEQALIAVESGAQPVIVCPWGQFEARGLDEPLRNAGVKIHRGTAITDIKVDSSGFVREILVADHSGSTGSIPARALFLASGLVCDWTIFRGARHELFHPALLKGGIASGLEYWKLPAHVEQADRLVSELVQQIVSW